MSVASTKMEIKIAVVGAGNCFSALYQGLTYYKDSSQANIPGVMFADIGGYRPNGIKVVAVYDVDARKVGKPTGKAIFAQPNCARVFAPKVPDGPIVQMGHALDGFSDYMLSQPEEVGFRLSKAKPVNMVKSLKECGADILVNYLPVGSQEATEFYAQAAIDAGVAFLNCI
ncbi:MAG: inositol-3-phosphate synthase, partial [Candidatus Saccharimonadales bacterium]